MNHCVMLGYNFKISLSINKKYFRINHNKAFLFQLLDKLIKCYIFQIFILMCNININIMHFVTNKHVVEFLTDIHQMFLHKLVFGVL